MNTEHGQSPINDAAEGSPSVAGSLGEVLALYEQWGAHTYDEDVTQLAHALQCAEQASLDGASDELVAAALLHDVGHLLELANGRTDAPTSDLEHEVGGARFLSAVFPASVTTPIGLHVLAKRYLCAVEAGYAGALSAGSTASLAVQGGPLDEAGAQNFIDQPGSRAAVALRRWDDLGKRVDHESPALTAYADLLVRVSRPGR